MNFNLSNENILLLIATVFGIGVSLPSPVQPIFQALQKAIMDLVSMFKKPVPTPEPKPADIGKLDVIKALPDIVRQLTVLLTGDEAARRLVVAELIKLLRTSADDLATPGILEDILNLLTQMHAKRPDIDLSPELSAMWTKVAELSARTTGAPSNER